MKKISSGSASVNKRVLPVLWFGLLAFFASTVIRAGGSAFVPLTVLVAMAIFVFFLMKKTVWGLVDEVYDCGDFLLIRNRGEEDKVALSNIMNVSASLNPPRITLRLVNPGKFGNEIVFSPVRGFTLNPYAKDQVSEDLILRVDQARSNRAT